MYAKWGGHPKKLEWPKDRLMIGRRSAGGANGRRPVRNAGGAIVVGGAADAGV